MKPRALYYLVCLCVLSACSSTKKNPEPTIAALEKRPLDLKIAKTSVATTGKDKAVESYQEFLKSARSDPLRPEAMRRVADLQMEIRSEQLPETPQVNTAVQAAAKAANARQYGDAVALYEQLLKNYPDHPSNDSVYYQLAKAHDETGQQEKALAAFDQLIKRYPYSKFYAEVQFRRGELLFVRSRYPEAQQAYAAVLKRGDQSVFYQRAIYKLGWSLFKQSRYQLALDHFIKLLDEMLVDMKEDGSLDADKALKPGDKELLQDTFRVVSLSLSYLQGERSIRTTLARLGPRKYEFLIYQNLGALYLKQERVRDAAAVFTAFVERAPQHRQAPLLLVRLIDAYRKGNFVKLALETQQRLVAQYGYDQKDYWRRHDDAHRVAVGAYLKRNLVELAKHFHARAQDTATPAGERLSSYRQAARWYRSYIESFPKDTAAATLNFLLAETLFESKDLLGAAREYEKTAYDYPAHKRAAEAGYAALIAYTEHEKSLPPAQRAKFQTQMIDSYMRFANQFSEDARAPEILTRAAQGLFKAKEYGKAANTAQRVLDRKPAVQPRLARIAWSVLAHAQFELSDYDKARVSYEQAARLTLTDGPERKSLMDGLTASTYKLGEQARKAGDHQTAVEYFLRVGQIDPNSTFRPNAEYDAASSLMNLQQWDRAIKLLKGFRQRFPNHALTATIPQKLVLAYGQSSNPLQAAREYERIGKTHKKAEVQREATLQAAELFMKANALSQAKRVYADYTQRFPTPLEPLIESYQKLADLHKKQGQTTQARKALEALLRAERAAPQSQRSNRTHILAAQAAVQVAEPALQAFRRVRLVEPLQDNLRLKKAKMQTALQAYERAAAYSVAGVTTAATYQIAEIYAQFGQALLKSQRPKGLSKEEQEQYNVLLEEQAIPFEEKAIAIHQTNTERVTTGVYDQWVRKSFERLGQLSPARYAKRERAEDFVHVPQ